MVNVKTSFNIGRDFDKKFATLSKDIVSGLQQKFRSLRSEISDAIDEAVESHNDLLIPTEKEAVELGVGEGGSVDRDKTNNAWQQLLSNPRGLSGSSRPTQFSVTKLRSRTGIGSIRITIDEDKFYGAPLSTIETESEIEEGGFASNVIPWMMWFVRGKTIGGVRFSSDPRNVEISRTGKGIMIKGGLWSFAPGVNPFPLIQQAIEQLAVEAVERFIERNINV